MNMADPQHGESSKERPTNNVDIYYTTEDPSPIVLKQFPQDFSVINNEAGGVVLELGSNSKALIELSNELGCGLQQWKEGKLHSALLVIEQVDAFDGVHHAIRLISKNSEIRDAISEEAHRNLSDTLSELKDRSVQPNTSKLKLSELDLGPTQDWAQRYEGYRILREEAPITFSLELNAWVVTRYADVLAAARDPRLDLNRIVPHKVDGLSPELQAEIRPVTDFISTWMIYNQNPEHMELKKAMSRTFSKANVAPMGELIRETADDLIDQIIATSPDQTFDFVRDYAHPLPAIILGRMLGVPRDGVDRFLQWSDQLAAFMQNFVVSEKPDTKLAAATAAAIAEMQDFFGEAVARRRAGDGPHDALHDVARKTELPDDVIRNQCIHLMFGGHKVPEFLAGNLLYCLFENPSSFKELRERPELIDGAVQEAIRYESPIQFITRAANEPVPFYKETLQPGDQLMLYLGSANRDPRFFQDPDNFNIHRTDNKHLGFGAGTHACSGMPLVSLELREMMLRILDRFPTIRPANPGRAPNWMDNPTFHGLRSLPVQFEL
jgi:cytochrome P450